MPTPTSSPVITAKAKGKHKQPPTTKLGKSVSRARAVYTSSNNQVTLTPPGTLNLTKSEELIAIVALRPTRWAAKSTVTTTANPAVVTSQPSPEAE